MGIFDFFLNMKFLGDAIREEELKKANLPKTEKQKQREKRLNEKEAKAVAKVAKKSCKDSQT